MKLILTVLLSLSLPILHSEEIVLPDEVLRAEAAHTETVKNIVAEAEDDIQKSREKLIKALTPPGGGAMAGDLVGRVSISAGVLDPHALALSVLSPDPGA